MSTWLGREIARTPRLFAIVGVLFAATLAYANSLRNGFHFDDNHHVVGNPYLHDLSYVPDYFTRADRFSAVQGHDMYRPAVLLSFALNYHLGGHDPFGWRLTTIVLHAICSVGVFLLAFALARRLYGQPPGATTAAAFVAALFFAVHPAFTETINYASARSSLLATCGCVWAFLFHLWGTERGRSVVRLLCWGASLGCLALALLSKEIAVVFPALLLWTAFLARRGGWAVLAPCAVVALYLYARHVVLGHAVIDFGAREAALAHADTGSGGARPVLWNLYTQARVVPSYLFLFLAPFGLCVHRHVRVSESPFELGVILGAAIIIGLLVLAWRLRRRQPLLSLGVVWYFFALAPTSSLIPLNQVMNEHRLYLPGVGVALLVAGGLLALHVGVRRRAAWPVAAASLCLLLVVSLDRNRDWSSSLRLWESATRVSPRSDGAWNGLATARRRHGEFGGALAAAERAIQLAPDNWTYLYNLGVLYSDRARVDDSETDYELAEDALRRALAVAPAAMLPRWRLGDVYARTGRLAKARVVFESLAARSMRLHRMTRFPLARIALRAGDRDTATALYEEGVADGFDPVSAHLGLARMAEEDGDKATAVAHARRAQEARPHAYEPHVFLAHLFKGSPRAVRELFAAQQRGYRMTALDRADILGRPGP